MRRTAVHSPQMRNPPCAVSWHASAELRPPEETVSAHEQLVLVVNSKTHPTCQLNKETLDP